MTSAALKIDLVSVADYLALESKSSTKHEYVDGVLHAMAGVRIAHDIIVVNVLTSLANRLRGKKCRPHSSDMKIRIRISGQTRFYYPDASVVCRSKPRGNAFQDKPAVIVEVLSNKTRRIDLDEKKDAYLTIPSLGVYVLIEQDSALVAAYRRTKAGFIRELHEGLDAVLPLPEIGAELPLAEIYSGAELEREPEDEDED